MLIVAVDTSGKKGSVALCRGDGEAFEVLRMTSLEGGAYSAQLIPRISGVLSANHVEKRQLDGFAVVSGPGSFTGLRVGLSTVKGLCEVLKKPLATVSMLEAIALVYAGSDEAVTAMLDAGRGEAYVGEYRVKDGRAQVAREYHLKSDELLSDQMRNLQPVVTPDTKLAETLQSKGVEVRLVDALFADTVGRLGINKLVAGEAANPETLDANYVRRSDAELFPAPKA
jgi:tRNA threonylcarbamoyladenosine biosynthesis protein TsaB